MFDKFYLLRLESRPIFTRKNIRFDFSYETLRILTIAFHDFLLFRKKLKLARFEVCSDPWMIEAWNGGGIARNPVNEANGDVVSAKLQTYNDAEMEVASFLLRAAAESNISRS